MLGYAEQGKGNGRRVAVVREKESWWGKDAAYRSSMIENSPALPLVQS